MRINRDTLRSLFYVLIVSMLGIPQFLVAQETDTTQSVNIEYITDQLENIAQTTDLNLDYSDLIDEYLYYSNDPININGEDNRRLVEMKLLNEVQLRNLNNYIQDYGGLYSVFELKTIPGFDAETIKKILPFITVSGQREKEKFSFKDVFKYGSHQIILRYQEVLEPSVGYETPIDSAIYKPGSAYLGSPQKYYLRYGFNYKNKVRIGFTMDKDAGEVFLKNQLTDTLSVLVGNKVNNIFDFISAHAYISDIGILKNAVIGDYHLEFGQGLTLWSGLAFGKSAEGIQIKRYGRGVRPNTSANENRFFRGAAATIGIKGFELTGFYSNNRVDGNAITADTVEEEDAVSSIIETGLHRTINELLDKDVLKVSVYGGRFSYQNRFFQLGAIAFQTKLNLPLQLNDDAYKQFYFQGDALVNYGFDLNIDLGKVSLFGEFSASSNGGLAGIGGINAYLHERFIFTVLYHDYGKDYHNLFSYPFSESSALLNEQGLYFGFKALLLPGVSLSGYIDYYKFPWLRYQTDAPSLGSDYTTQLDYSPSRNTSMYFRYRHRNKQENYSGEYDYIPMLSDISRNEFRFFISYQPFDFLIFKNRIDFTRYKEEFKGQENGYLMYQDILYRPEVFPVELTFRYALFDTDGYDSRIYTYENDILYAFSVPSYFDKGQRVYLMLKWRALEQLNVWFRVGRLIYSDRATVGSGTDLINENQKTEIKVQVQIKL
ncbi:MAG: helix-hairpin-helix domain-containing protein [Bacteroidetes bacterium]|nr:helix-hairpin-helix domain-containing protein [Bacteroidota bacterium]